MFVSSTIDLNLCSDHALLNKFDTQSLVIMYYMLKSDFILALSRLPRFLKKFKQVVFEMVVFVNTLARV